MGPCQPDDQVSRQTKRGWKYQKDAGNISAPRAKGRSAFPSPLPSYLYPEPVDPHDRRGSSNLQPVPPSTLPQHGPHTQQQQLRRGVRQWVVVQLPRRTRATPRRRVQETRERRRILKTGGKRSQDTSNRDAGRSIILQQKQRFGVRAIRTPSFTGYRNLAITLEKLPLALLRSVAADSCLRPRRSRAAAHLKCLEAGQEPNAVGELLELVVTQEQLPQTRETLESEKLWPSMFSSVYPNLGFWYCEILYSSSRLSLRAKTIVLYALSLTEPSTQ